MIPQTGVHPFRNTVLFVDGTPVGYQIFRWNAGFRLVPDDLLTPSTDAPEIQASYAPTGWQFHPQVHRDLADQVVEDLELYLSKKQPGDFEYGM
jgi:hypothetical protein